MFIQTKNKIDVIKYKWLWIGFSLLLVIPSIIAMAYSMITYPTHSPFKLGLDFTGGTLLQYGFEKDITDKDISVLRKKLEKAGIVNAVIQKENKAAQIVQDTAKNVNKTDIEVIDLMEQEKNTEKFSVKTTSTKEENKEDLTKNLQSVISLRTKFLSSQGENNETVKVNEAVKASMGNYIPLQTSAIGPTLGNELFKNAMIALILCFFGIVGYLTVRFSIDYAVCALIALFHDAIFVCGVFSLFGLLFHTEIDSLFITAILTVIGFSVHDTIVVFDRIRENSKFYAKKLSFNEIVNASVNQTLARSINTSLTALITLIALYFFGGSTTKDFILAMILGITVGTYSSIFNASVLLSMWREQETVLKPSAA